MHGSALGGVVLVHKSPGITSHDVVDIVRRSPIGRGAKVGHAGTLDPFATGLLVVLVGKATRVQRFFTVLPKTYRTRMRLGVVSDTGDPTGKLVRTDLRADEAAVKEVLPRLVGEVQQRVPLTSAVKVGGERLYLKARRGEQVNTPIRTVQVHSLTLVSFDADEQCAQLELDCSSGTYVRQLVADLGTLCGAGAYCESLERLAVGPFKIADADPARLIPLAQALTFLPERVLSPAEASRARHGVSLECGSSEAEAVRLTSGGELIAVAERRDGSLRPTTVLG